MEGQIISLASHHKTLWAQHLCFPISVSVGHIDSIYLCHTTGNIINVRYSILEQLSPCCVCRGRGQHKPTWVTSVKCGTEHWRLAWRNYALATHCVTRLLQQVMASRCTHMPVSLLQPAQCSRWAQLPNTQLCNSLITHKHSAVLSTQIASLQLKCDQLLSVTAVYSSAGSLLSGLLYLFRAI